MTIDYKQAYSVLIEAGRELYKQDLSELPQQQQLQLAVARRKIYSEIQALEMRKMAARTDRYRMATTALKDSQDEFKEIRSWAENAERSGKLVANILKGFSLVLSLF
jgi:hypothetical protein